MYTDVCNDKISLGLASLYAIRYNKVDDFKWFLSLMRFGAQVMGNNEDEQEDDDVFIMQQLIKYGCDLTLVLDYYFARNVCVCAFSKNHWTHVPEKDAAWMFACALYGYTLTVCQHMFVNIQVNVMSTLNDENGCALLYRMAAVSPTSDWRQKCEWLETLFDVRQVQHVHSVPLKFSSYRWFHYALDDDSSSSYLVERLEWLKTMKPCTLRQQPLPMLLKSAARCGNRL